MESLYGTLKILLALESELVFKYPKDWRILLVKKIKDNLPEYLYLVLNSALK